MFISVNQDFYPCPFGRAVRSSHRKKRGPNTCPSSSYAENWLLGLHGICSMSATNLYQHLEKKKLWTRKKHAVSVSKNNGTKWSNNADGLEASWGCKSVLMWCNYSQQRKTGIAAPTPGNTTINVFEKKKKTAVKSGVHDKQKTKKRQPTSSFWVLKTGRRGRKLKPKETLLKKNLVPLFKNRQELSPFWFVSHSDLRKECINRSFSLFIVYYSRCGRKNTSKLIFAGSV